MLDQPAGRLTGALRAAPATYALSPVMVVFVSGTDDDSADPAVDYVAELSTLSSPSTLRVAAITSHDSVRYLEAAAAAAGPVADFALADWGDALHAVGREASGMRRLFVLANEPVEDTVEVDGEALGPDPTAWSYDPARQAVVFTEDAIPPFGAEVSITYVPR